MPTSRLPTYLALLRKLLQGRNVTSVGIRFERRRGQYLLLNYGVAYGLAGLGGTGTLAPFASVNTAEDSSETLRRGSR